MSQQGDRRGAARPQLDREVIISAAIELASTGAALTFRQLGSALGADPTAVYRHFRDKEELMRAVADRLIVTANAHIDRAAPWRDQLHDGAVQIIDIFAAHPRIGVEASAIATGGPGELAAIDWILTQLGRAGLDKRQVVRFYAAYSSYVLAAASSISWQRLRHDDESTSHWVGELRAVDAARLPALAAAIPELVGMSDREAFLTGVEVFLDSVEAVAERATESG